MIAMRAALVALACCGPGGPEVAAAAGAGPPVPLADVVAVRAGAAPASWDEAPALVDVGPFLGLAEADWALTRADGIERGAVLRPDPEAPDGWAATPAVGGGDDIALAGAYDGGSGAFHTHPAGAATGCHSAVDVRNAASGPLFSLLRAGRGYELLLPTRAAAPAVAGGPTARDPELMAVLAYLRQNGDTPGCDMVHGYAGGLGLVVYAGRGPTLKKLPPARLRPPRPF